MTQLSRTFAGLPRVPLAVLLIAITVAIVSQVLPRTSSTPVAPAAPAAQARDGNPAAADAGANPLTPPGAIVASVDLDRIRKNVKFWGDRAAASPRDFVSAGRLAASQIELARATGDVSAYLAAGAAIDAALAVYPEYEFALAYQGVVQIALHRFVDARESATALLAGRPDDAAAIATLGDASLELGDIDAAAEAYARLQVLDGSEASLVRVSHLAFIQGRTEDAVAASRSAVTSARENLDDGNGLAWYEYQLGETLIATGDRAGAAEAYAAALAMEPRSHLARWGLARVAAADGDLDGAITQLSSAIDIVPLPDFLARRADLYRMRAATGDAKLEANDRKTVLAIAQLSGEAATVYDRALALYLAGTGDDPVRALALAEAEIEIRKDVYGYDALAWALLANDRPEEAQTAIDSALAFGTRDAKVLYHAGMIAAARGDDARARELLTDALAIDASFDPYQATLAQARLADLQ